MDSFHDIVIRFNVDPTHSLSTQNQSQEQRSQTLYETCWYVETDKQKRIVARYRSWCNQALSPPYRAQIGWERYSPTGTLLTREVRYTKQDESKSRLH